MCAPVRSEQLLDVALRDLSGSAWLPGCRSTRWPAAPAYTRPIVYEHFGDLEGLLEAIVEREMSRALEQVAATELGDLSKGDPLELMMESLGRYLSAVAESPATWRLVLTPPDGAPASLRKRILRGRARVLRSLTDAVRPGSLPGGLGDNPELTARMLSAMADEYARLTGLDPDGFPPQRLLSHAGWTLRTCGRSGRRGGPRVTPSARPIEVDPRSRRDPSMPGAAAGTGPHRASLEG